MNPIITRRDMLSLTAKAAVAGALLPNLSFAREERSSTLSGAVVGEPVAAKIGERFLADGANAIDAAIATAFASSITSPGKCGVGGYGGHAIIALANGRVTAIDFNSSAPAAARDDMFPLDDKGNVKGKINVQGWLAAGVPGVLAGMDLILKRYGTRPLSDVLAPAIELCEGGVRVTKESAREAALDASKNDASPDSIQKGSATNQQNLPLAKMLRTLAGRNSTESFYRGDIARTIADAFQKNGGLITFDDLAAYHAREVKPLTLEWNGMTIHTPPLTAAGVSFLEAIAILKKLDWEKLSAMERLHAKVDALRIAWMDRNAYFGDPEHVKVPLNRIFSSRQLKQRSKEIGAAIKNQKATSIDVTESTDDGTMNISAVDGSGNMIALTFTHGSTYGARVSVEEFGMVLGHGMWRFETKPGHPNSPGPRKKAVNNMCPAAITRGGKPVMAVGGAGGTRIPCSIYEVLLNYVGLDASLETAINAPRINTTGTLERVWKIIL
ncbi:MAG: gamma-glutamyltransferase [Verrucomicrobia bacterium]|nr:gamma-glutamyltransferase [Verrucomicrobiota bacterium]